MFTLLSTSFKVVASQGINLGTAAVLLLFTLFLLYISAYAIVRNRKKKAAEPAAEPQPEEKTIKPKMKGYDRCELNEIMGYDFIQTQYIGGSTIKEKEEQEQKENRGEKKSYAESRSTETTEINESVIGVTGTDSNIPKDEPEETPAERKKRLAEQAAMKAQEEHTKAAAQNDVPEEEIPEEFIDKPRGDFAGVEEITEAWPENMDSCWETEDEPDPISGDWQEEFATEDQKAEMTDATGIIEENDEEDAEVMNNLAGEPEDREQMNALLMNSSVFKDIIDPAAFDAAIDDQDGTESHKQFFLEQLRDEYVSQNQSKPSNETENENSDNQ